MIARNPLTRRVLTLALPLMAANLSQTLMSLADMVMVGRLDDGDPTPLAAMGPSASVFLVTFLIASACFAGIQALTARRFGAGRLAECGRVLGTGLALAFAAGLVASLLGLAFSRPLARFLVEDARAAELAGRYLTIRVGGIFALTVLWAYKGFLFGIGRTRTDMGVAIGMNALNIGLNWVFLWGNLGAPELGMPGAGLASALATAAAALAMLIITLRPSFRAPYALYRRGQIDAGVARRIVGLSGPRAVQAAAFGGSVLFFKLVGDHCGTTALAATAVIWRFFGFNILVSIALGASSATLVGQSMGAGRLLRAELAAHAAARLGVVMNAVIAAFVLSFPDLVLSVFTEDAGVIAAGRAPLRLMSVFQVVDSVGVILSRSLSAAGCALYVMSSEIVVMLGIMLPTAWLMTRLAPGSLTAMWLAWVVYILSRYTSMTAKFLAGGWKLVRI